MNEKELAKGDVSCVEFPSDTQIAINMQEASSSSFGLNKFNFDRVFDTKS